MLLTLIFFPIKKCFTPLSIACQEGHVHVAECLLLNKAEINHQTEVSYQEKLYEAKRGNIHIHTL